MDQDQPTRDEPAPAGEPTAPGEGDPIDGAAPLGDQPADAEDRVDVDVPVDIEVGEAAPDEVGPEGEASQTPDLFFWALWIGVFAVILWGMLLLFRGRTPNGD